METVTISLVHYNELRDFMVGISEKSHVIWQDSGGTYYAVGEDEYNKKIERQKSDASFYIDKTKEDIISNKRLQIERLEKEVQHLKNLNIQLGSDRTDKSFEIQVLTDKLAESMHVKYVFAICAAILILGVVVGYLAYV